MPSPTAQSSSRRSPLRAAVLFAAAAASTGCLALGAAVPASAEPAAAASTPGSAVGTTVNAAVSAENPPTQAELDRAREQAAASAAKLAQAQADLAAAQSALDALAAQANAALEAYQQAVEAKDAAVTEEAAQRERLAQAEATLAEGKKDLGQWASQAYRGGGSLSEYSGLVSVLKGGATDDTASAIASAKRIGDGRSNAVEAYEEAQRVQADATVKAAAAAEEARKQADLATAAKQQADALVAQQRSQVQNLAVLQAAAAGNAASTADHAANLAAAKAQADAAAAAYAASAAAGSITAVAGDCDTGISLVGFANGLIPRSALCPLTSAPGHVLRSDAANAFTALNQAYAAQFGKNISVTDSYRTLAEQIDVKARKPGLAAKPGTSRHGLGIAVDLGDGIQNADSAQHQWMDRNAALYGWINPAWAQNRSGQFEPWHWEFTG
ncbi:M15 family metallopeptidase [Kineococcus rhizosphaerae]|uniref:D-alanyl-D-alanine carboxypeptidase-like protein n=1 Tax=Kineococcus rhizosphaerae TaxID=559628 RepID=A0A2T0RAC8_9ACTN|nr:M15 family metallopeptidase [Kineococcus rhizosphaerae]PRY18128.1 D-alanyl-D-alanine carboxypeptidase-like protein [Kineococcus rhizosphaerae]